MFTFQAQLISVINTQNDSKEIESLKEQVSALKESKSLMEAKLAATLAASQASSGAILQQLREAVRTAVQEVEEERKEEKTKLQGRSFLPGIFKGHAKSFCLRLSRFSFRNVSS